ncbi:MAG: hypothetical protein K0S32_2498 [Bacteroidetes bacterium]|jgi:REP element-mobilizing transposase RayT|nr:hypothetical protein [Bacteroidota bacterium]
MKNKTEELLPSTTYHIFNRANGNEKLFLNHNNYEYFIEQYKLYIEPIAETFSYCLMPNHFHLLIRMKPENELNVFFGSRTKKIDLRILMSQHFSNFFNGYTKAFNKMHKRKGSLFMHPYKRIKVSDNSYLLKLVHYINFNPIESGLCTDPLMWKYSSYIDLVGEKETFIKREELITWFDDLNNFKAVMNERQTFKVPDLLVKP